MTTTEEIIPTIKNKTNILIKYLTTLKNIIYSPFFYKIIAMLPVDIYNLLLGNNHTTIPGYVTSECFDTILNFLFIDINILYDFLYNEKYKTKVSNVIELIGNDFKTNVLNDTEKIYSSNNEKYGIINDINNNKNNILVKELIEVYPYYNTDTNEYYKKTKFISIINFINTLTVLLNKEYSIKNEIVNILLYIMGENIKYIDKCINIYNKLKSDPDDNTIILDKLDNILNDYSSDSVLTFIKIRSDYKDDYNARFNYKLYGKTIDQKKYMIDNNGKISVKNEKVDKKKIIKLNYNDDDINYYKKSGDIMIPNYDKNKFNEYYPNSEVTTLNYIIPETDYKYTYILGPLSEVYDYKYSNKEISDKLDVVINSLIKQKPVLIIGYGASGAGKTSTLIYFNKGQDNNSKNGILVHLCNRMAKEHQFNKVKLKCREFFVERNNNSPDVRNFPSDKNKSVEFIYNQNENTFKLNNFTDNVTKTYKYENKYIEKSYPETETLFNENSTLGELIIHLIDNDRFVAATTNNPNSSRSHSLIFVTLVKEINDENNSKIPYESTIIIGDFAGVENLFDCDSDEIKENFFNVNRDDTRLDIERKKKINDKIEQLKLEVKTTENQNEIDKLTDILSSFDNNEYYKKYPIQPEYDKEMKKEYVKFEIKFDDLFKKLKLKKESEYKANINDIKKRPFVFKPEIKNPYLTTELYNLNTEKYINDIIKKNFTKDDIINAICDILNTIKNKNFLNNFRSYDPEKEIYILLLKCIYGIKYDNNNISIQDIFNIKSSPSNTLLKYITNIFDDSDKMSRELIRYIIYFVNIFNKIKKDYDQKGGEIFEKNKILNYGKEVCLIRRNEGIFINNTLTDIRDLINYIMIEKNKYKLSLSPPFVNECLNFYCTQETCFELKKQEIYNTYNDRLKENEIQINIKNNLPFKSIIFNTIVEELGIKVKDIIISVFCVFNISKGANNPPPVPYISINKLKYLYNHKKYNDFITEINKFNCYNENNTLTTTPTPYTNCILSNYDKQKIKNIISSPYFKDIVGSKIYIEKLKNNNVSSEEYSSINNIITKLFTLIDNFNSASVIGTLEFVDSLSKYNTISNICNKKDFKPQQNTSFDKTY